MCVLCTMNLVIISIKSLTVTARTKDLLQGNLTRGQFYIKGRAKGHGKKKKKKKQSPNKQKRRYTECPHSRCFGGVQVPALYTLNVVSDWHNEEKGRINGRRIHLQQFLTVNAGL